MFLRTIQMLLTAMLAISLAACNEKTPPEVKAGDGLGPEDSDAGGSRFDSDKDTETAEGADSNFELWCTNAAETSIVKEKFEKYYELLCNDGKPTKLFADTLVDGAYDGSGTPEVVTIDGPNHDDDNRTTAMTLAVGLEIPITVKKHFDEVGPKAGDPEAARKLAEEQGAESEVEILEEYEEDGTYHVRGWKTHGIAKKPIPGTPITITTDTTNRADHWQLEDGKAYMYTSYVIEAEEGVSETDMFTAGVASGDGHFLLTIAFVEADNRNLPSVAVSQIKQTAVDLAKQMYTVADDAK